MTAKNFPRAMTDLLNHEGGFDDDPRDRGNWSSGRIGVGTLIGTKFGIDAASHPGVDIRNLTIEAATTIYRAKYWDAIRADELPSGLDYAVFDFGVNSGPQFAMMYLQELIETTPDGRIGPLTLAAISTHDTRALIISLCDKRLAFMKRFSIWSIYGRGWGKRIVDVKALSLSLVV